jgi:hypothetical protein
VLRRYYKGFGAGKGVTGGRRVCAPAELCAEQLEQVGIRPRRIKEGLIMFRGMHDVLELIIESRCNKAAASIRSRELRRWPGQVGNAPILGTVSPSYEANTARYSID